MVMVELYLKVPAHSPRSTRTPTFQQVVEILQLTPQENHITNVSLLFALSTTNAVVNVYTIIIRLYLIHLIGIHITIVVVSLFYIFRSATEFINFYSTVEESVMVELYWKDNTHDVSDMEGIPDMAWYNCNNKIYTIADAIHSKIDNTTSRLSNLGDRDCTDQKTSTVPNNNNK